MEKSSTIIIMPAPGQESLQDAAHLPERETVEWQQQVGSIEETLRNNAVEVLTNANITLPIEIDTTPVHYDRQANTDFSRRVSHIFLHEFNSYLTQAKDYTFDEVPGEDETKGNLTVTWQLKRTSQLLKSYGVLLQEHKTRNPNAPVDELEDAIETATTNYWDAINAAKQRHLTLMPLMETIIPSREALVALINDDITRYEIATGIKGLDKAKMDHMIEPLVSEFMTIDVVSRDNTTTHTLQSLRQESWSFFGGDNFKATVSGIGQLIETALVEDKQHKESLFRVSEQALVSEKIKATEGIPVSPDLRYSLDVIAYNEMPSTEGYATELPNLALQLRSIITAVQRYKEQGGKPGEIEVVYNINNAPGKEVRGNQRSLQFLQGILGTDDVEVVLAGFDWVPPNPEAVPQIPAERAKMIRTFYTDLITEARAAIAEGFHIVPIDCTDGKFISRRGNSSRTENAIEQPTQGSRRLLTSELALHRLKQSKQPQQYMTNLDADILITPTYFTEFDKVVTKDSESGEVYVTSPRLRPYRGFYSADLVKPKTADGTPLIETFTQKQLDTLANERIGDPQVLLDLGLTQEQADFILQFSDETIERVTGKTNAQATTYAEIVQAIKTFTNHEKNVATDKLYYLYVDIRRAIVTLHDYMGPRFSYHRLLTKLQQVISPDTPRNTSPGTGYLSTHLISRKAYEQSNRWDIRKDDGEDTNFLTFLKRQKGIRTTFNSIGVVRIRDRARPESYMGGNLASRTREHHVIYPPKGNWSEVEKHVQNLLKNKEKVTPQSLPSALFTLLTTRVRLNDGEKMLIQNERGKFSLREIAKEGPAIDALALANLLRYVMQEPSKYPHICDFFIPFAAYLQDEKKEPSKKASSKPLQAAVA